MYCKKCGRQLRSEARFCDHCGQSVRDDSKRGGSQKRANTSRTAIATKTATQPKTRADYEKKQRIKREQERKQKQKNVRIIFFLILIAIVAATALGFASYNMTKKELNNNSQATETPQSVQSIDELLSDDEAQQSEEQDEEPTAKPAPKSTEKASKSEQDDDLEDVPSKNAADFEAVADEFNIYRDDRMDSIRCPYPKNFEQGSKSNKNTVLSLVDPLNDGAMMISAETVGTSKSASSLMKDYAEGIGGNIQTSRAGDGWYTLSFERNNKVNHRKAVVVDGLCVYYDFSYDVDSSEKNSYDEYIEYIDYYIEKELTSLTEKEKSKN